MGISSTTKSFHSVAWIFKTLLPFSACSTALAEPPFCLWSVLCNRGDEVILLGALLLLEVLLLGVLLPLEVLLFEILVRFGGPVFLLVRFLFRKAILYYIIILYFSGNYCFIIKKIYWGGL